AGVSMLIALILNLTVLPALLAILRPPTERVSVGFGWARPIDRFLSVRCRWVVAGTVILVALSGAMIPRVHFESDPLKLQDGHTEAMSTLFDLMANPSTTPYTIDVLTTSPKEAATLAARIENLSEVSGAITVSSFIPTGQDEKLSILDDVKLM